MAAGGVVGIAGSLITALWGALVDSMDCVTLFGSVSDTAEFMGSIRDRSATLTGYRYFRIRSVSVVFGRLLRLPGIGSPLGSVQLRSVLLSEAFDLVCIVFHDYSSVY
jgi:hypothetical protein